MTGKWKKISRQEAQAHPLYGNRGWLLAYTLLLILGFIATLLLINGELHLLGVDTSDAFQDSATGNLLAIRYCTYFDTLYLAAIILCILTKNRNTRIIASALMLSSLIVAPAIIDHFTGHIPTETSISLISMAIPKAIWIAYLNLSRRVRVTFEHRIQADTPDPLHSS